MHSNSFRLIEQPFAAVRPGSAREGVKAKALHLQAGDPLHRALSVIVGGCLEQLRGNEAGVRLGADPACVHQMRVGLRRLRAALRLFEPVVAPPQPLCQELLWLGGELGAARDWAVLTDETLADWRNGVLEAERPDGGAGTGLLLQAAREAATQGRDAARAAVGGERYARLIWNLVIWVERQRVSDGAAEGGAAAVLAAPLASVASSWLEAAWLRLRRRARGLNQASASQRHRLRIAAKRMRYATEFLQSLHEPNCVRPFVARLTELQDELGRLNDAVVAQQLLQRLADGQLELAGPARHVRHWLDRRHRDDRRRLLLLLWRRCDEAVPPWR